MLLNTLYFYEEVQKNPAKDIKAEIGDKELSMAKMLIDNLSAPLKISDYRDEYRKKLQEAIELKIAGKEIVAPKERREKGARSNGSTAFKSRNSASEKAPHGDKE